MTRLTNTQRMERDEAIAKLHELLPPGSEVRTILRHVSRSGMMRAVSPVINGEDASWLVARALNDRVHQHHGGVIMGGAGMDMGFALVYNLSRTLYPDGFSCIGEGSGYEDSCPANDHVNDRGQSDYSPERHHNDGGYALRHRWL